MKKPRKPYRPRLVNVPVTQGLVDQYAQDLRFPLMAAELGHFNTDAFDKIGAALNVIWAAVELKPLRDPSIKVVIEGGMRTMNEVSARGDKTGTWKLTQTELASVTAAANKAEQALPHLTGIDLRNAMVEMAKVRAKAREEERMAA
jgi:hypothetical protein